jgi:hypothetical protein
MANKNKLKKVYVIKSDSPVNSGEGSLFTFLSIPHEGTPVGDRILLRIFPASKRQKLIEQNTMYLLRVYHFKQRGGTNFSDSKFYNQINFHTDWAGRIAYLSVPTSWMEEV